MFIRLYELSDSVGDHEMRDFCRNIIEVFEEPEIMRTARKKGFIRGIAIL